LVNKQTSYETKILIACVGWCTGTKILLLMYVPLFLKVRDFKFVRREKHIISHFLGVFLRGRDFFDVEIVLSEANYNYNILTS
jgi:hypothetical protein